MSYSVQNIRNVCLLGHSGSGKTALTESLLYMTGAIDRMGKAADGNTVCDYDPEEIKRQISISTSVAPLEYKGCKINILDAPGAFDFAGDVMEALTVADAAIIVCSAKDGISVGLEKAWKYCEERDMPRFIYISKTDEENSDYNATFDALRERFGNKIAPLVVPIWDEGKKVTGIIDVLNKRAYEMQNGKRVEIDLPEGKDEVVTEFNDALKESVAETSEEFMDKFFSGEDFTYVEMIQGLRQGVRELSLFPVLCGSAVNCMGSLMLLDDIVDLLPNPMEGNYHKATRQDGETEPFVVSPGGVPTAFVFKTVSDQYGKYSFVKVLSGTLDALSPLRVLSRGYAMVTKEGRVLKSAGEAAPGDKVAIVEPDYFANRKLVEFFGGELCPIQMDYFGAQDQGKAGLDLSELEQAFQNGVKLFLFSNPNNPTGALMPEELLEEIIAIARRHNAYILCDEVYRHLTQEEGYCPSIVDLYEKGISVSSMSKVFSLAGLRMGWIATRDEAALKAFLSHRDYNLISCGMFDDAVASIALAHSDVMLKRNQTIVRENLAILDDWVASHPHFYYTKPKAGTTALVYYDFDVPSYDFCKQMYHQTGAFVTPGDCFQQPHSMRIGYACDKETLQKGLEAVSVYLAQKK